MSRRRTAPQDHKSRTNSASLNPDADNERGADCSGLGAPASTAVQQAELEAERQAALDLRRVLEEHDDELAAAARETNRRLMNQINRPGICRFQRLICPQCGSCGIMDLGTSVSPTIVSVSSIQRMQ